MQIHALELSISATEATEWVAPALRDAGIEQPAVALGPEGIVLCGRASRPFPMPFRIVFAPRCEGHWLWLDLRTVQAAGPLGSWLQGPLLALAASRLADMGVEQQGKSLGMDLGRVALTYAADVVIEHLDVRVEADCLRIALSGTFSLGKGH